MGSSIMNLYFKYYLNTNELNNFDEYQTEYEVACKNSIKLIENISDKLKHDKHLIQELTDILDTINNIEKSLSFKQGFVLGSKVAKEISETE